MIYVRKGQTVKQRKPYFVDVKSMLGAGAVFEAF